MTQVTPEQTRRRLASRLGRALRQAREERGLTLRAAAQLSGNDCKASSIAGYERGERTVSVVRFCTLATLYGVAPERLLERARREEDGTDVMFPESASHGSPGDLLSRLRIAARNDQARGGRPG
jgi:transcriptional regulator with XRE-family HTH domain